MNRPELDEPAKLRPTHMRLIWGTHIDQWVCDLGGGYRLEWQPYQGKRPPAASDALVLRMRGRWPPLTGWVNNKGDRLPQIKGVARSRTKSDWLHMAILQLREHQSRASQHTKEQVQQDIMRLQDYLMLEPQVFELVDQLSSEHMYGWDRSLIPVAMAAVGVQVNYHPSPSEGISHGHVRSTSYSGS